MLHECYKPYCILCQATYKLVTQDQETSPSRVVTSFRLCTKQVSLVILYRQMKYPLLPSFFLVHLYQQYSEYNSIFLIWGNTPCCYCTQMKSACGEDLVLVKPAIKCSVATGYLNYETSYLDP